MKKVTKIIYILVCLSITVNVFAGDCDDELFKGVLLQLDDADIEKEIEQQQDGPLKQLLLDMTKEVQESDHDKYSSYFQSLLDSGDQTSIKRHSEYCKTLTLAVSSAQQSYSFEDAYWQVKPLYSEAFIIHMDSQNSSNVVEQIQEYFVKQDFTKPLKSVDVIKIDENTIDIRFNLDESLDSGVYVDRLELNHGKVQPCIKSTLQNITQCRNY